MHNITKPITKAERSSKVEVEEREKQGAESMSETGIKHKKEEIKKLTKKR